MTWRDDAQCAGRADEFDADLIARRLGARKATPGLLNQHAWMLCRGCPTQAPCAREALAHGDRGVIAAGTYLNGGMNARVRLEQVAAGRQLPQPVQEMRARDRRRLGIG